MKVSLERINNDYLFEGKGPNNISVAIDSKINDEVQGASPMELLLMAVGGCNAIDIISILKKQRQEVTAYKVEVEGARAAVKDAKPFTSMHVKVFLEGEIDPKKAKRAAALSFDKYCSVSITIEKSVKITYEVILNGIML